MMNIEIHDRETFGRVTLAGLSAYLEARGWERRDNWRGRRSCGAVTGERNTRSC